jgi:hypothetical protein
LYPSYILLNGKRGFISWDFMTDRKPGFEWVDCVGHARPPSLFELRRDSLRAPRSGWLAEPWRAARRLVGGYGFEPQTLSV